MRLNRYVFIVGTALLAVVMTRGAARAQALAVGDPGAPDQTLVEGAGVKVGEGTVLHPVVGVETGWVSNVFYTDQGALGAPIMRALVELNFASQSHQRAASQEPDVSASSGEGDIDWRAGIRAIGQEYISSNDNIDSQHNIAGGANIHALVFPRRTWRFGVDDDYVRDNRPTNYESRGNLNRDINQLILTLKYEPEGRALSGSVRYQNLIDVFERSNDAFANRIQHLIGLRANWQWLPITKVFADISLGFFEPLGSSSIKTSSMPLRAVLGIQTSLTLDTAVTLKVGYGDGFYSSGPDASQPIFAAAYVWRYAPTGQLSAQYWYDFVDSIQANYFRDHAFEISDTHQFDKLTIMGIIDGRLRNYQGINIPGVMAPDRSDLIFDFDLSPRYYIKDWFAATVDYDLTVDSTDFRYTTDAIMVNPSYVRHVLMAGVRAAW